MLQHARGQSTSRVRRLRRPSVLPPCFVLMIIAINNKATGIHVFPSLGHCLYADLNEHNGDNGDNGDYDDECFRMGVLLIRRAVLFGRATIVNVLERSA